MESFNFPDLKDFGNKEKGRIALKLGKQAENFVYDICENNGIPCQQATLKQDHAESTDLIIYDKRVQVSLLPKSKKQRRKLLKKGIYPLSIHGKTAMDIIQELKSALLS